MDGTTNDEGGYFENTTTDQLKEHMQGQRKILEGLKLKIKQLEAPVNLFVWLQALITLKLRKNMALVLEKNISNIENEIQERASENR